MSSLLYPRYGGAQRAASLSAISPSLFHWRPRVPDWDPVTGKWTALSGHSLTWTRNGTAGSSITDSAGNSYTPPAFLPGYLPVMVEPEGGDPETLHALRTIRQETLISDSAPFLMRAHCGMWRGIPRALTGHASDEVTLFGIGTGSNTDPYLRLSYDEADEVCRLTYFNGTTSVTSETEWLASYIGEELTCRWLVEPTGNLTLVRSVNRGSEDVWITPPVLGSGGAFLAYAYLGEAYGPGAFFGSGGGGGGPGSPELVPPDRSGPISFTAWASGTRIRVNGMFGAGDGLPGDHLGVILIPGELSRAAIEERW